MKQAAKVAHEVTVSMHFADRRQPSLAVIDGADWADLQKCAFPIRRPALTPGQTGT